MTWWMWVILILGFIGWCVMVGFRWSFYYDAPRHNRQEEAQSLLFWLSKGLPICLIWPITGTAWLLSFVVKGLRKVAADARGVHDG